MIQELLGGGAGTLGGERKMSISGALLEGSPSTSPCPSSPTTTTAATTTTTSSDQQNLRCPRCDSSNTKFCYYNNYNLTQPRHFCKTCRRYWTKGGALRNVPIGGGCRKSKNSSASTTTGKSSTGKLKTTSSDMVRSSLGFDHEPASNPILWASPQNSQLLTLLRATQHHNPNPNSMSTSASIKGEGTMIGSHMTSDSAVVTGAINARPTNLDPLSQLPIGLCSSLWRNNQHQSQQHHHHHHHHQQHQHNFLMGEVQNTGIQEFYQRLRSSANYYTDQSPMALNNVSTTSSSSSTILEASTVAGGEMGYWNPAFSWSNLPTTNGAFP